eukprot:808561-Rhodomonas_salina.2
MTRNESLIKTWISLCCLSCPRQQEAKTARAPLTSPPLPLHKLHSSEALSSEPHSEHVLSASLHALRSPLLLSSSSNPPPPTPLLPTLLQPSSHVTARPNAQRRAVLRTRLLLPAWVDLQHAWRAVTRLGASH